MSAITENVADTLTSARRTLSALEAEQVRQDAAYQRALDSGDVGGAKAARTRRDDLADEIAVAKAHLSQAEAAAADAEYTEAQAAFADLDAQANIAQVERDRRYQAYEQAALAFQAIMVDRAFAERRIDLARQRLDQLRK